MRRQVDFCNPITSTWGQVGLFKLALLSLSVLVGAIWPEVFAGWRGVLLVWCVVPAFYLTHV